jgi:hypothetical protein
MRPRPFVKLLWFIMLVALAVFINGPLEAAGSTHPNSSDKILQFTSGGHILGFGAEGAYVASGSHALHVQFVTLKQSDLVGNDCCMWRLLDLRDQNRARLVCAGEAQPKRASVVGTLTGKLLRKSR